ncbi:hypothetical protein B7494_g8176 [Chlorociboria aeruginascens]|nr:hypothetical protein B7494_g8176 [Chlorociboria aeruginascens]
MATGPSSPDLAMSDTAIHPDDLPGVPKTSAAVQPSISPKQSVHGAGHQPPATDTMSSEKLDNSAIDAKTKISNLLKDKAEEWAAVVEKKGPLQLLDLPMDVLKEIVKEVTHTNDLTALALTHSALHNLAIPHIYSRFDIVWPDAHATTDPRTGVDALTYGLATLCMGDVYTNHTQPQSFTCSNCGTYNTTQCNHDVPSSSQNVQRRLNQYPQYTRKFSLGNGPADWVQEYLITKESGKMLGTLVALAVARMTNLETFVWDMPTGVLRDVWLSLSSLQSRNVEGSRLDRVWVRWHDNSESASESPAQNSNNSHTPQMLAGSTTMSYIGWVVPAGSTIQGPKESSSYAQSRVEYPTLSVLSPLTSLSVLDIDELDYLDEMSVLIAKSKDRLRELRIGIAAKAIDRDFTIPWDAPDLYQVDHEAQWPGASTIGKKRLGGVLGVLLGRVFDIRKKPKTKSEGGPNSATTISPQVLNMEVHTATSTDAIEPAQPQTPAPHVVPQDQLTEPPENSDLIGTWDDKQSSPTLGVLVSPELYFNIDGEAPSEEVGLLESNEPSTSTDGEYDELVALLSEHEIGPGTTEPSADLETATNNPPRRSPTLTQKQTHISDIHSTGRARLEGKLRLQTLEMERVPLSIVVLQKAFDWSVLTNLTILDCPQHDRLWVMLRRHFQPSPVGGSSRHASGASMQYHLNLRKLHTDAASPALIFFLKETLAPNTLETLFLQDRKRSSSSSVTIDSIYRGPLKRHRASLKKLLLDSSDKVPRGPSSSSENNKWRAWMPNRDVLNFITSGRMSSLRELGIAIDYKDWHHFLQRLPQVPHLRSLNVPFIGDHVTPSFDPRELALQVVDVIVLRPEVELCYMGVAHKCFEILENRPHDETHGSGDPHSTATNGGPGEAITDDDEEDDDDEGSDEDEDDDEEEDDNGTAIVPIDPDETESEVSDHDSDTDSNEGLEEGSSGTRLRLREILFYDDKIRHANASFSDSDGPAAATDGIDAGRAHGSCHPSMGATTATATEVYVRRLTGCMSGWLTGLSGWEVDMAVVSSHTSLGLVGCRLGLDDDDAPTFLITLRFQEQTLNSFTRQIAKLWLFPTAA